MVAGKGTILGRPSTLPLEVHTTEWDMGRGLETRQSCSPPLRLLSLAGAGPTEKLKSNMK